MKRTNKILIFEINDMFRATRKNKIIFKTQKNNCLHMKNDNKSKPLVTAPIVLFLITVFTIIGPNSIHAQRWMEKLGRGVVATKTATNKALISWRILGLESNTLGFNVYRKTGTAAAVKLNVSTLIEGTNFEDVTATFSQDNAYFVTTIENGVEGNPSEAFTLIANAATQPYYDVPIPDYPGYSVKFIWTGDLNGDGEFDFVYDRQPIDDSLGVHPIVVEAVTSKGKFLWRLDCGENSLNRYNITPGSSAIDIGHGDGITVFDINNDGKAEVLIKTANGVKFPDGTILRNSNNAVQYASVLEGATGKEISRVELANDFANIGQMNGHFGIAYLDGVNPCLVWSAKNRNADKSFNMNVSTYKWSNGGLVLNWKYKRTADGGPDGHNLRIADVDGDGKDEIIPFGYCLNSDGKLRWNLDPQGVVHGDRFFISDMDPARPGLEGYAIQQDNASGLAWIYYDATNGKILHSQKLFNADGTPLIADLARGCAGDLDPRYPGFEFFTFTDGIYNVAGTKTSNAITNSYPNLRIWWDGDVMSECLDNGKFIKWNHLTAVENRQYTAQGVYQVGPKTPGLLADITGDWREEAIYTTNDNRALRVFTTPLFSTTRIYTLAHNPKYRADMTVKGYYQGNNVDYFLGNAMAAPVKPNIKIVGATLPPPPPANIAPTVGITAPLANASFTAPASVAITATAADADGTISNVQFYNGTALLGSDATAPYTFTWASVAAGTYSLTAKATDNDGAVTTSTAVSVTVTAIVANTPPTVSLTAPLANASFTAPASVAITATAADADGTISNVQFYNGTTLLGSDATAPYTFTWANVAAGTYSVTAKATDNGDAIATSTVISVTVISATTSTADIIGQDCGVNNIALNFELNATKRVNVTTYNWWYTGSAASTTPIAGSPYKVSIQTGDNFSAGQVCVGTNLSAAPWYTSYCKSIIKCAAQITVSPNPSNTTFVMVAPEAVSSYTVSNYAGTIVLKGNEIAKGASLQLGGTLNSGNYALKIKYKSGQIETKIIQKIK